MLRWSHPGGRGETRVTAERDISQPSRGGDSGPTGEGHSGVKDVGVLCQVSVM